ncbi:BolA domain-containing protein/SufE domain-containing protein, partial [Cephalotus follicularis]
TMASSTISSSLRLLLTKIPICPKPAKKPSSFYKPVITFERIPTKLESSASSSMDLQPIADLPPKLQEIINLFQSVQDQKSKYEQLMFYGKNLKPLEPQFKTSDNKVQGCVSQVWVRAYLDSDNKNVFFEADSDSVLTKGLVALLVNGLSGRPVEEVLRVSPDFVELLGLQQKLSRSRNNGFLNMLNLMQKKALELLVEAEKGSNSGSKNDDSVSKIDGDDEKLSVGLSDEMGDDGLELGRSKEGEDGPGSGDSGNRGMRIREILERELTPTELEVEDVSYQHAGHAGVRGSDGETHFNVKVVSKEFEGKSLVKRHRLVYNLLQEELQSGLHALSITAKTPAEVGAV